VTVFVGVVVSMLGPCVVDNEFEPVYGHTDIGKRRKEIIFAKIYRLNNIFCSEVQKMIVISRFSYK
jgi:hypothetical protein